MSARTAAVSRTSSRQVRAPRTRGGHGRRAERSHHLAHGLLDHAWYLLRLADIEAAEEAISRARNIARNLRREPLLDRARTSPQQNPQCRIRSGAVTIQNNPGRS